MSQTYQKFNGGYMIGCKKHLGNISLRNKELERKANIVFLEMYTESAPIKVVYKLSQVIYTSEGFLTKIETL